MIVGPAFLSATSSTNTSQEAPPDFQTSFKEFMQCYNKLAPEQKRQKVSKVIGDNPDSSSSFAELLDLFWAEGLSREIGGQRGK